MGVVVMLILAAVAAANVLVVVVAGVRYFRRRPGRVPAPYAQYRPEHDPGVITAEALVCDTYQVLADLYVPPPSPGRQPTP